MTDNVKRHLTHRPTWLRLFVMLLFTLFYGVTEVVITAVVLFQVGSVLFTGSSNERLRIFGEQLATYLYEMVRFLTFRSETRPFPFGPWPEAKPAPAELQPSDSEINSGNDENDGG